MVRGCRLVTSIRLNFVRLGADKANVALQQVLSDIEEVKCDVVEVKSGVVEVKNDVVARVAEVKAEVVEVKNDAQEVKCMRFHSCIASVADWTFHSGAQIEQDIYKWFSPPDPYTNYNIACEAQSEGTAAWFFQGRKFKDWTSIASLLWIHGKRKLRLNFTAHNFMTSDLRSRIWEKHTLVCDFSIIIANYRNSE